MSGRVAASFVDPAPAPLRLAVIGAGKVGCSLARFLGEPPAAGADSAAGDAPAPVPVAVAGFYSRQRRHASEAAAFAGGTVLESAIEAAQAADVLLITTPDGQIDTVWKELAEAARAGHLNLEGRVVAHCSGALSSGVLTGASELGALPCSAHPLYAVSSRFGCWRELARAWFCLEGDPLACGLLDRLLTARGARCRRIAAEHKTRYHAAAVMASNLVCGLYARAADELSRCGFSADEAEQALAPLFLGNAEHLASRGVRASLTGPAARGDRATVEAHLACLDGEDREIYGLLTEVIYRIASDGRPGGRSQTKR